MNARTPIERFWRVRWRDALGGEHSKDHTRRAAAEAHYAKVREQRDLYPWAALTEVTELTLRIRRERPNDG